MQVLNYPFKFQKYRDTQDDIEVHYVTSRQFADFFAESWSEDSLITQIWDYLDALSSRGALPQPLEARENETIITYISEHDN